MTDGQLFRIGNPLSHSDFFASVAIPQGKPFRLYILVRERILMCELDPSEGLSRISV